MTIDARPGLVHARETPTSWDDIGEVVERTAPGLFAGALPRIFRQPAGYLSPKQLAHRLVSAKIDEGVDYTSNVFASCATDAVRLRVPVWFLGREMGEALASTDLPEGFTIGDVPFPFPTWVLMLPEGLLVDGSGFSVPFIIASRMTPLDVQRRFASERDNPRANVDFYEKGLLLLAMYADAPGRRYGYKHFLQRTLLEPLSAEDFGAHNNTTDPVTADDDAFMRRALHVVVGAACIIANRPEFVEDERALRRVKVKALGGKLDLVEPRWVGRNYKRQRERRDTVERLPGAKRSPHFRRGHWRRQRIGKGWTEERMIWIEPIFVAGATAEATP
ncbi:MAG TPA: hypothetical protein VD838_14430 [Anaeromyxobacteraceae bacterium]|nr:hypothetical protein [Anaeromyxobacteraceae bacterium]